MISLHQLKHLSKIVKKRKNLNKLRLDGSILSYLRFEEQKINKSIFNYANFYHCKFINSTLIISDFKYCRFFDCNFRSMNANTLYFNNSNFDNCSFHNSTFNETNFNECYFNKCKFDNTTFIDSYLEGVEFNDPYINVTLNNTILHKCKGLRDPIDYIQNNFKMTKNGILAYVPLSQINTNKDKIIYRSISKDHIYINHHIDYRREVVNSNYELPMMINKNVNSYEIIIPDEFIPGIVVPYSGFPRFSHAIIKNYED